MRVAVRFQVGCVSTFCLLLALACSSEPTPNPSGTGGSASATGGAPPTGGTSTGGTASTTGGTSTGGTAVGTGGVSTGGTAVGTGGTSTGGVTTGGTAGAQGGTTTSTGGSTGGVGGNAAGAGGTAAGAGGNSAGAGGVTAGAGGKGGAGGGGAQGTGGTAGAAGSGGASGGSGGASGFTLTSPAWTTQAGCAPDNKAPCGIFPKANTNLNGGKSESPELNWTGAPASAQSFAIVLHDLSNLQQGNPFVHWVMWNIPGATNKLPAGLEKTAMPSVPAGSSQRSVMNPGFFGSGKCGNVYEFVLYALPMATFTPTGTVNQTTVATALKATGAPTATLRARSGAPECTE